MPRLFRQHEQQQQQFFRHRLFSPSLELLAVAVAVVTLSSLVFSPEQCCARTFIVFLQQQLPLLHAMPSEYISALAFGFSIAAFAALARRRRRRRDDLLRDADLLSCPLGHELVAFVASHAGYTCDRCREPQDDDVTLHGCRDCDFDLCGECFYRTAAGVGPSDDEDDDDDDDDDESNESFADNFAMLRNLKMVLVVNGGLIHGGSKKRLMQEGKMAAQCCHAAVGCVQRAERTNPRILRAWSRFGCTKVALKAWPSAEWLERRRVAGMTAAELEAERNAKEEEAARKKAEAEAEAAAAAAEAAQGQKSGGKKKKKKKTPQPPEISLDAHLDYLREIQAAAAARGIPTCLVQDAGRTQIPPGTTTVLGLGPFYASEIDELTGPRGTYACKLIS